jgi:hypothetical protein
MSLQQLFSLLILLCPHQFSGNGFQRQMYPSLWVPELSQCLSYQLLTATAHNDRTPAVLSVTHQRTQLSLTSLRKTSRHGPHRKHHSSVAVRLLLSGGTTYSIAGCAAIGIGRAENRIPVVIYGPLPSNGSKYAF